MSGRHPFVLKRHRRPVEFLGGHYKRRVEYEAFQVAVIDLASKGVSLTVANVVAHLHIDPRRAETFLDRMVRDGRVDLEVDEVRGAVVYSVRGLSTSTGRLLPDTQLRSWRMPSTLRVEPNKSVTMAVMLGLLVPGLGLAYAAPLRVVMLVSFIVIMLGNLVGAHTMLGPIFWMGSSIASALLGGLYAVRFNQEGHRATLHP